MADLPHLVDLPYRPGVGIMLVNTQNRALVARRIDTTSEAWQMPQGGIDPGESPLDCALRELKEEIGTDRAELIAESPDWHHYDLPASLVPKIWKGQYRGQKQRWFLMRFTGVDSDINLETEHPEFLEWKWTPLHTLPELIVPFKRELYAELVLRFQSYLK